jgi:hypothetical protein
LADADLFVAADGANSSFWIREMARLTMLMSRVDMMLPTMSAGSTYLGGAGLADKIEVIARAQQRGVITTDLAPADLLVLLLAMITSRFHVARAILDPATEDAWSPQRLHQHRAALTTAVGRLVAPSPHPQPGDTDLENPRQD